MPTTPSVPWLRSKALLVDDFFFVIFLWDEKLTIEHMGLMMVNLWDIMGHYGTYLWDLWTINGIY